MFSFHHAAADPSHGQAATKPKRTESYGVPVQLGRLQDSAITESSGLVSSRVNPGIFWTHNDSGDGPFIYAFDRQGKSRGVWRVIGASARDWEDIAAGPGPERKRTYLFVGDVGNNDGKRTTVEVYRFLEPAVAEADMRATKSKPRMTAPAAVIRLRYPDGNHDAETLLVHPVTGDIYIITKEFLGKAGIYKATAPFNAAEVITLKHIGALNFPSLLGGFVTGGDISPDGHRVAICDYTQGYELVLSEGRPFDEIWRQPIKTLSLGTRKQGEAIAYRLDGKALLTTSEGVHSPLTEVVRR